MTPADTLVEIAIGVRRLDAAAAPAFKQEAAGALVKRPSRLVLDLSAVEFVDSTGLGALVGLLKQMAPGARVALVGVRPAVQRLLQITRLNSLFIVSASVAEARHALAG